MDHYWVFLNTNHTRVAPRHHHYRPKRMSVLWTAPWSPPGPGGRLVPFLHSFILIVGCRFLPRYFWQFRFLSYQIEDEVFTETPTMYSVLKWSESRAFKNETTSNELSMVLKNQCQIEGVSCLRKAKNETKISSDWQKTSRRKFWKWISKPNFWLARVPENAI